VPTSETLWTLKQKPDEILKDIATSFYNVRNEFPRIQYLEIIIGFKESVTNIKTIDTLMDKESKPIADLLTIVQSYVKLVEVRARVEGSKSKRNHEERSLKTKGRE
jgi:hypothetical protein